MELKVDILREEMHLITKVGDCGKMKKNLVT